MSVADDLGKMKLRLFAVFRKKRVKLYRIALVRRCGEVAEMQIAGACNAADKNGLIILSYQHFAGLLIENFNNRTADVISVIGAVAVGELIRVLDRFADCQLGFGRGKIVFGLFYGIVGSIARISVD